MRDAVHTIVGTLFLFTGCHSGYLEVEETDRWVVVWLHSRPSLMIAPGVWAMRSFTAQLRRPLCTRVIVDGVRMDRFPPDVPVPATELYRWEIDLTRGAFLRKSLMSPGTSRSGFSYGSARTASAARAIAALSLSMSTGLTKCSRKPASRLRRRSSSMPKPLTAIPWRP